MTFIKWFETFLEEKNLPWQSWEFTVDGWQHYIDQDVVIEGIKNCSDREQQTIKVQIVKIDFANGNVNDFFKFLARAMIATRIGCPLEDVKEADMATQANPGKVYLVKRQNHYGQEMVMGAFYSQVAAQTEAKQYNDIQADKVAAGTIHKCHRAWHYVETLHVMDEPIKEYKED